MSAEKIEAIKLAIQKFAKELDDKSDADALEELQSMLEDATDHVIELVECYTDD